MATNSVPVAVTIRIGGAAGDGVESSGAGFCTAMARGGLYVFGVPDYYSRIRGGHNFYSVRVSPQPLYSHEDQVHLLLALTAESIPRHQPKIAPGGAVLYDTNLDVPPDKVRDDITFTGLPLSDMAQEAAGTTLARNTVALGFASGITGYDIGFLRGVIRENFARKGQQVIDGNLAAVEAGYAEGQKRAADFPYQLSAVPGAPARMVVTGTEAFALGALAGGCRFVAGYPMTPGSLVLHWMAAHSARYGVVIKHTEDEIAAINMAIGAAHMGARALVPTSGGGFSLMVEALGLAGMTETPVVVYNAQRPGPSTGLPTRHEQSDLLFMLYASQGEFPRFLLAPGTHEQAFVAGWRSFNLAEKYQTPVLVLSDHYLATAVRTMELDAFDFDGVQIDRGELLSDTQLDALDEPYLRFRVTESGVSPRAVPGHPSAVWVSDSDEHNENGSISEEIDVRIAQMDKRLRKSEGMVREMSAPALYGPPEAEVTFICWGSTVGPLREAVDRLNSGAGVPARANLLHMVDLWPMPVDAVSQALGSARRLVAVEVNATGQLAQLIRMHTGRLVDDKILKYDGRPFTPEEIVARFPGG
jgi:2-oxoglutarate/2-oxoacid ferredoxin oxidoreductase subunit alpha